MNVSLRWVFDGQTVYVSRLAYQFDGLSFANAEEVYVKAKVITSAGDSARIRVEGEDKDRWVRVDDLFGEEDVARDAADRLGA